MINRYINFSIVPKMSHRLDDDDDHDVDDDDKKTTPHMSDFKLFRLFVAGQGSATIIANQCLV